MAILTQKFYRSGTEKVARELLGCTLVHVVDGVRLSGRIVETEAYLGIGDAACHSFGDRRTPRTETMYLDGGHAYVYFIYGMHFCFNVVTRKVGEPEAVLIRALEPLEGIEEMKLRRDVDKLKKFTPTQLANGPAKLCQALGINRSQNAVSLQSSTLFIEKGLWKIDPSEIVSSPRVGVDYAGEAASWPLRFRL